MVEICYVIYYAADTTEYPLRCQMEEGTQAHLIWNKKYRDSEPLQLISQVLTVLYDQ